MSSNTDDTECEDSPVEHISRRTILVSGASLGVAGLLGGVPSAEAGSGEGSDCGRSENRSSVISRAELTESGLGNAQTDTPPFMPRLKTYNGRQYFAYWTFDGELVVAARDLPGGEWEQNHLDIQIGNRDGHWTPGVGIGPEGHIFLNYNTRNSVIRWRRSEDAEDISAFSDEHIGMTGENESSVTYLEFTRLHDGTLLAGYRQGGSGQGDWIMNRWDPDSENWEPLHHPLISGIEDGFNSYMWNLVQSDDGMLHYFFNWRRTGGVQSNINLCYARSPDGGETWERSDGAPYDLPITLDSSEVVDPIDTGSSLINQGWASYNPQNGAPHVTYYRNDENDHTQVFHAYRDMDAKEWVIDPATNRTTDIDLGGGGTVASPIGRMGIVVGDEGEVHILTRDYEHGSWPLLIEKLDGEWQTSIIYKRNLTWSDIHIDPTRWREDRILSFIDISQAVGDVPWGSQELLAITDVDLDNLNRSARTIDLADDETDMTSYVETDLVGSSVMTTSSQFEDTTAALALSETNVPGSPMYARVKADLATEENQEAAVRVKMVGQHGTTYGEPATGSDGESVTTEWTEIPQALQAGFTNLQVRSNRPEWSDYAFESTFTVESEQAGFVFRAQDEDNFYMWQVADASHGFDEDLLRPHVRENGQWEVLGAISLEEFVDNVEGEEHSIRIEANGDEITTYLNGQKIDQRTDDTHATGRIGFRQPPDSVDNRTVLVDTIAVTDLADDNVLFETAFEHDEPTYFEDGEIVDGQLRLGNTGLTLVVLTVPTATISDAMLELGYDDPTSFEQTVAPQGSSGADNRPLAHMLPVNSTGLQEEAPVNTDTGSYENTPTSLEINRATPTTPVFARVTARMEPYGDTLSLDGANWIWYPDDDPAWDVNEDWAEGTRYFRRTFTLDEEPTAGGFVVTADNLATVYVNGEEVGTSADSFDGQPRYSWRHAPILDVSDTLQAGENTISIVVERFGHFAGLIGRLEAEVDGETVTVDTDGNWLAADELSEGWTDPGFDDTDWPSAQVNGEYGMDPWGRNVTIAAVSAEIRLAMADESYSETKYGDSVTTVGRQIRTTGWQPVPSEFNGGTVWLQAKDVRVTAATLELAIRNEI